MLTLPGKYITIMLTLLGGAKLSVSFRYKYFRHLPLHDIYIHTWKSEAKYILPLFRRTRSIVPRKCLSQFSITVTEKGLKPAKKFKYNKIVRNFHFGKDYNI